MSEVKTMYLHWYFCEYSEDGVGYILCENKDDPVDSSSKYTYIEDVEVPTINSKSIQEQAVQSIDNEIAALRDNIRTLDGKKASLLCLEHNNE